MNLHEYQGKEILSKYGVKVQRGIVATTPEEAVEAAKQLTEQTGTGWHVVKAQVHAGGRGKGGGVKLAKNLDEVKEKADEMEKCIGDDISDNRFIPYIQLHEFEALLYSSNVGFEAYFSDKEQQQTKKIIDEYPNPEDINSSPEKAPSKRLLAIKNDYDKVIEGNMIASEVGLEQIMNKCPRFKAWIDKLISACKDD